jgi:hypothetical protein
VSTGRSTSHVRQSLSASALAELASRPGIDPRVWVSSAVVTSEIYNDPEYGPMVDITLVPSMLEETAILCSAYVGAGWGLYLPVELEDEVVVMAPGGDPNNGYRIIGRNWNGAEPPPAAFAAHPHDAILWVRQDQSLRLNVSGSGDIVLNSGTHRVARAGDPVNCGGLSVSCAAAVPPPGVVITVTYTPPTGTPWTQVLTLVGALTGAVVSTGSGLSGVISDGAPHVLA